MNCKKNFAAILKRKTFKIADGYSILLFLKRLRNASYTLNQKKIIIINLE